MAQNKPDFLEKSGLWLMERSDLGVLIQESLIASEGSILFYFLKLMECGVKSSPLSPIPYLGCFHPVIDAIELFDRH
jgi:hypothetical protein